jgi:hypothetical protein
MRGLRNTLGAVLLTSTLYHAALAFAAKSEG